MSTGNLIRWSGMAFVAAGIFQILGSVLHPDNNDPTAVTSPSWVLAQLTLLVFYALCCFALFGLRQQEGATAGRLGRVGFYLALAGSAFAILISIAFAFPLVQYAAQRQPLEPLFVLLSAAQFGWLSLLSLTYVVLFVPGFIMTGIAIVRSGVLPRWAGWLISAGILISFIGAAPGSVFLLRIIGGVVFGLGLMWLGYAMWSEKGAG